MTAKDELARQLATLPSTTRTHELRVDGGSLEALLITLRLKSVSHDCYPKALVTWTRGEGKLVPRAGWFGRVKMVEVQTFRVNVTATNSHYHRMANLRLQAMAFALTAEHVRTALFTDVI